jgi:hypothetical protein
VVVASDDDKVSPARAVATVSDDSETSGIGRGDGEYTSDHWMEENGVVNG